MEDQYARLLRIVRSGWRPNAVEAMLTLERAGRTTNDLLADLCDQSGGGWGASFPGDTCECGGRVKVASVRRNGGFVIRRLVCPTCGKRFPDLTEEESVAAQHFADFADPNRGSFCHKHQFLGFSMNKHETTRRTLPGGVETTAAGADFRAEIDRRLERIEAMVNKLARCFGVAGDELERTTDA